MLRFFDSVRFGWYCWGFLGLNVRVARRAAPASRVIVECPLWVKNYHPARQLVRSVTHKPRPLVGRPAAQLELAIDRKAAITKRAPAFDLDFAIGRYATWRRVRGSICQTWQRKLRGLIRASRPSLTAAEASVDQARIPLLARNRQKWPGQVDHHCMVPTHQNPWLPTRNRNPPCPEKSPHLFRRRCIWPYRACLMLLYSSVLESNPATHGATVRKTQTWSISHNL